MSDLRQPAYFTTVLGNGQICPISEFIGRRRVRQIEAGSREGKQLLREGRVTILTRDGQRFSGVPVAEVFDRLVDDVDREQSDPATDPRARGGLGRLLQELDRVRRSYS